MEKVLIVVYKIVWTFIMLLFEIYERMYYIMKLCKLKIMNSINFRNYKQDQNFLKLCQKNLEKIPKHLSIIIGSEDIDRKILSNIVIYALMLNIKYLSFYDIKNALKLDEIHIPKFIYSKRIKNDRLLLSMPNTNKETKEIGHKNGLEKSIEVKIYKYLNTYFSKIKLFHYFFFIDCKFIIKC